MRLRAYECDVPARLDTHALAVAPELLARRRLVLTVAVAVAEHKPEPELGGWR